MVIMQRQGRNQLLKVVMRLWPRQIPWL